MLVKIDNALDNAWGVVLKALCYLSGKSNFFFARCFIVISITILASNDLGPIVLQGSNRINIITLINDVIWFFILFPWCFRAIKKLERSVEDGVSILDVDFRVFAQIIFGRLFLAFWWVISLIPSGDYLTDIEVFLFNFLMCGAGYFALNFHGPKAGILSRIKDWVGTKINIEDHGRQLPAPG